MPSIQANATSTLALLVGIVGSLFGYREHLSAGRRWMLRFAPVSVIGGLIGAWMLTCTSSRLFDRLVPFLILFATILFLASDVFRRFCVAEAGSGDEAGTRFPWVAMGLQFGVALYGGYFGAGIGILMLATLGFMGFGHIHEMNAIKTVLGALINVVAAGYFVWAGLVIWPQAALMTVGALVGYYAGSRLAQAIPQKHVRTLVGLIGLCISGYFFYRQFLSN